MSRSCTSIISAVAVVFLAVSPVLAQAPWQGRGRIAISSDGNEHDHDDWAATPLSLALLAAGGLQAKLALYTFSDHVWGSNHDQSSARSEMRISALEGADLFGFSRSVFLEAAADPDAAYNGMRDQINKSTAEDPLIIIAAGPMQVVGTALSRANTAALPHVRVISHSDWNDRHADNPSAWESHSGWTWAEMENAFKSKGVTFDHIVDQNGGADYDGLNAAMGRFDWIKNSPARNHAAYNAGSWDWLYARLEKVVKNGNFDASDAGMVIYLLSGQEKTEPPRAKTIMENPVVGGSSSGNVSGSVGLIRLGGEIEDAARRRWRRALGGLDLDPWFRTVEASGHQGYTLGMKTAVSIPDDVFERAERLARSAGQSRSAVFSRALREYVARHAPDEVTEAMDRVCAEVGDQRQPFVAAAARRTLEQSQW